MPSELGRFFDPGDVPSPRDRPEKPGGRSLDVSGVPVVRDSHRPDVSVGSDLPSKFRGMSDLSAAGQVVSFLGDAQSDFGGEVAPKFEQGSLAWPVKPKEAHVGDQPSDGSIIESLGELMIETAELAGELMVDAGTGCIFTVSRLVLEDAFEKPKPPDDGKKAES